jgi:anion-transporting  ArsA/GET3 family ATPase
MLRAPRTFANVAAGGPIHRQAMMIHDFLADPRSTGVLAVALPEEMPVNETLDLEERLGSEMGMSMSSIVVNALLPERFSTQEAEQIGALDGKPSKAARAALAAALTEHRRARAQRSQLRRLRRETDVPVTTLPYLFEPDLGVDALDRLSRELERRL